MRLQLKPTRPLATTRPIYPSTPAVPSHIPRLLGQIKQHQTAMRKLLNRAHCGHPPPMLVPSFLLCGSSLKHHRLQDEEFKSAR